MHSNFNSGAIFIDLPKAALKNKTILPALLEGRNAHGCWGGFVMQAPDDELAAGLIRFSKAEVGYEQYIDPQKPLFEPIDSVDIKINEEGGAILGGDARFTSDGINTWYITKCYRVFHYSAGDLVEINWSRSGFSDFAIQLLGAIDGLNEGDRTRHAFGIVYDMPKRVDTPLQSARKKVGEPHVEISLRKYQETESYIRIEQNDHEIIICVTFEVINTGDVEVEITADGFKNFSTLEIGAKRSTELGFSVKYDADKKPAFEAFLKTIYDESKPFSIKQRFAYRYKDGNGETSFFAVIGAFDVYVGKYCINEEWRLSNARSE